MRFILITSNGLPVYPTPGLPKNYKGELLTGSIEGAEGEFGLIVLQEKSMSGLKARLSFFQVLKNIFIRHEFIPETFFQALFSLGADIIYHIEGHDNVTLKKGDYIMVPHAKKMEAELKAGETYKVFQASFREKAIRDMAHIYPELLRALYNEQGEWKPKAREAGKRVQEVVEAIMNYRLENSISEDLYYKEQFRRLLYVMITQNDSINHERFYSSEDAFHKMHEQLLQDITNPPKIKFIAQKLFTTVNRLMTIFKQSTGMRPPEYISLKKMEIGYELVTKTNKSIKTIAAQLGFKKQQSFSTKFKAVYGKTPKQLRKDIYKSKE